MATTTLPGGYAGGNDAVNSESAGAGLSWGAILAGAAAAAALSLILMILGFGLGLSSVSPWGGDRGASATTIGVSTILWLTFTQLAASGLGGYLAGRLRVRWANLHGDEVYFRDTAHGFLAWAIATLITAALVSSTLMAAIGGTVRAGASVVQGAAQTASTTVAATSTTPSLGANAESMSYYVDSLFRTEQPVATQLDPNTRTEIAKILAMDLRQGTLPDDDRRYVGQLIARQTGLAQPEAEKRVADTFTRVTTTMNEAETRAREAADTARKAAAYSALWMFVALLAGAFFASVAALFGGRQRDEVK